MSKHSIGIIFVVMLAWLLSSCAPFGDASAASAAVTSTPAAPGAGGSRPANVTPGAQQPRAQATRQANATPSAQTSPESASTPGASASTVPTPTAGAQSPTAVPIPSIVIPTPLPANAAPATASSSSSSVPSSAAATPVPQLPPAQPTTASLEALRGKIVFFSDRGGLFPQLYVMNPDGSNPQLCNCSDLLPSLVNKDLTAPDGQQVLFVKQTGPARSPDFQIWTHNTQTNQDQALTGGPPGFPGVDYDPTWSPDSRHIAWVTETNGFDEIYVHDRLTNADTRVTQSQGEWYKHPSYAPDGTQLTYWTNLGNLNRKQVWVSGADGAQPHNISNNQFNDWDPIWVK
jgi:hypothetical protein